MTFIKLRSTLWKKPAFQITTAVDTEYVQKPEHPNQMITTQIAFSANEEDCIVLEHPGLKESILPSWEGKTILSTLLVGEEDYDETIEPQSYLVWEVLMFFAPADLLAGLFNDRELCLYIQRHCKQDARITLDNGSKKLFDKNKNLLKLPIFLTDEDGYRHQLVLKITDLGKIGAGSLKTIASSLGVKMEQKSIMDKYKKNILKAYKNKNVRKDYLKYAKGDACVLFELRKANQKRLCNLYETITLTPPDEAKEKLTTGSAVAGLFYDWLCSRLGQTPDEIYGENLLPAYEYFTYSGGKSFELEDLLKKCGVNYFANTDAEYSKQANALIQGGRAKNEQPTIINDSGVIADADLTSCYATILENLTYPVGLPHTYSKHESNKKVLTLGAFLKKHEKNLLPRLYTITVKGKLGHHQTLVPSKKADSFEITEKYTEDNPKIPADFRLYTKEIENGVITSDVLEALRAVCNKKEYASWMKLEVITAVWFPEYQNCFNPDLWSATVKKHSDKTGNDVKVEQKSDGEVVITDNRSRHWIGIEIKDFILPFKTKRAELKQKRNAIADKKSPEWLELDAQQNAMKLVCNTLYGVLASPYFNIGNVVVANNITAAARVAVWYLACAAGTYQSITDGGAYNLNQVRDWVGDTRPSMNTLSLWRAPKRLQRKYTSKLITKPLGSETLWGLEASDLGTEYSKLENKNGSIFEAKAEGWDYFDEQLLLHIKHFFRGAERLPSILNIIKFTHKDIYQDIVLHSQTNYQLTHISREVKTKARGHKIKGTPYENETEPSNIIHLFDALKANPHSIPSYHPQTISQVLKCNQANEMLLAKKSNVLQENNLLAGDSILKRSWVRPVSLSMFHWQTHEQYISWYNKAESLKSKYGYGIEQWFINTDGEVDYQTAINTIQDRIDDGWMWILAPKAKSNQSRTTYRKHKYL